MLKFCMSVVVVQEHSRGTTPQPEPRLLTNGKLHGTEPGPRVASMGPEAGADVHKDVQQGSQGAWIGRLSLAQRLLAALIDEEGEEEAKMGCSGLASIAGVGETMDMLRQPGQEGAAVLAEEEGGLDGNWSEPGLVLLGGDTGRREVFRGPPFVASQRSDDGAGKKPRGRLGQLVDSCSDRLQLGDEPAAPSDGFGEADDILARRGPRVVGGALSASSQDTAGRKKDIGSSSRNGQELFFGEDLLLKAGACLDERVLLELQGLGLMEEEGVRQLLDSWC